MLTKIVYDKYWRSWFLHDYKASSGEEAKQKSVKDGARNFFNTIRLSRYLSVENLKIIDAIISRNAFFALPENILLSMISDEQISIRQDFHFRSSTNIKRYEQPTSSQLSMINFNATHYSNMIDFPKVEIISPPVLTVTNEKLVHRLSMDNVFDNWEFDRYPCHTQAVERLVKLVTEASISVCGVKNKKGQIRAVLKSRQEMNKFDSKKDFTLNNTLIMYS